MDDSKGDYACAIGTFVLAINKMEEEISWLIEDLSGEVDERAYLSAKIGTLKRLGEKYPDQAIRQRILDLWQQAKTANNDRRGIVHSVLYVDPFTGSHNRRFAPHDRDKDEVYDPRKPKELRDAARQVEELADEAGAVAAVIRRVRGDKQQHENGGTMTEEGSTESKALGLGVAGGAVLTVLLDELLNKGVLTKGEIRGVLQRAHNGIAAFYDTSIGREAGRAISDLLARFPER